MSILANDEAEKFVSWVEDMVFDKALNYSGGTIRDAMIGFLGDLKRSVGSANGMSDYRFKLWTFMKGFTAEFRYHLQTASAQAATRSAAKSSNWTQPAATPPASTKVNDNGWAKQGWDKRKWDDKADDGPPAKASKTMNRDGIRISKH